MTWADNKEKGANIHEIDDSDRIENGNSSTKSS